MYESYDIDDYRKYNLELLNINRNIAEIIGAGGVIVNCQLEKHEYAYIRIRSGNHDVWGDVYSVQSKNANCINIESEKKEIFDEIGYFFNIINFKKNKDYKRILMCENLSEIEKEKNETTLYLSNDITDQKRIQLRYFDFYTQKWSNASKSKDAFSMNDIDINKITKCSDKDNINDILFIFGLPNNREKNRGFFKVVNYKQDENKEWFNPRENKNLKGDVWFKCGPNCGGGFLWFGNGETWTFDVKVPIKGKTNRFKVYSGVVAGIGSFRRSTEIHIFHDKVEFVSGDVTKKYNFETIAASKLGCLIS